MDFIRIIFLSTLAKITVIFGSVHFNYQNDFVFCQMGAFTSRSLDVCFRTCNSLKGTFSSETNKLVCFDQEKRAQRIKHPEYCQCGYTVLHHSVDSDYKCTPERKFSWLVVSFRDCKRRCNKIPALILNKFRFANVTVHCETPTKVYGKLGYTIDRTDHGRDDTGKTYVTFACQCGLYKVSGPETTFYTNVNPSKWANDTHYYYPRPEVDHSLRTNDTQLQVSRAKAIRKRAVRKDKIHRSMKLTVACPTGPFDAKNIDVCVALCRNVSAAFTEDDQFFCFNSVKKVAPIQLTDFCRCGTNHPSIHGQFHPCIPERKYPLNVISSSAECIEKCGEFRAFTYKEHKSQNISVYCELPPTRVIERLDARYGPTDAGALFYQESQDRCECGLRTIPEKEEFIAKCSTGSFEASSLTSCKKQCDILSGTFSSDGKEFYCFNREQPVAPIPDAEYCKCGYIIWRKEDDRNRPKHYPCVPEIKTPWNSITKQACLEKCRDYAVFILRKFGSVEARCLLSSARTFRNLAGQVLSSETTSNSTERENKRVTCECGLKLSFPLVSRTNNIASNTNDDEPFEQAPTNHYNFVPNNSNYYLNNAEIDRLSNGIPINTVTDNGNLWYDPSFIPSTSDFDKNLSNDFNVIARNSANYSNADRLWNNLNANNDSRECNSLNNNYGARNVDNDDTRVLDSVLTALLNESNATIDASLEKIFDLGGGDTQPAGDFDTPWQDFPQQRTTNDFDELCENNISREMLSKRSIGTLNSDADTPLQNEKRRKN